MVKQPSTFLSSKNDFKSLSILALFTEHPLIDKITKANKAKGK
jgi:hypothetical protein